MPYSFCYQKLDEEAGDLKKGTPYSAGYDLPSLQQVTINPGEINPIKTGICLRLPPGTYGRISPRSSWVLKGFDVKGGVIDCDYRGEVIIIGFNFSNSPIVVRKGECCAQIILQKISGARAYKIPQLPCDTVRGTGGFGSTDSNAAQ